VNGVAGGKDLAIHPLQTRIEHGGREGSKRSSPQFDLVLWKGSGRTGVDGKEENTAALEVDSGKKNVDGGGVPEQLRLRRGYQEVEDEVAHRFLAPAWLGGDWRLGPVGSFRLRPWRRGGGETERGEEGKRSRARVRVRSGGAVLIKGSSGQVAVRGRRSTPSPSLYGERRGKTGEGGRRRRLDETVRAQLGRPMGGWTGRMHPGASGVPGYWQVVRTGSRTARLQAETSISPGNLLSNFVCC
jgi:hypothetical protein